MIELLTDRLRLRAFDLAAHEAAVLGDDALGAHLEAPITPNWMSEPEALVFWLGQIRQRPELLDWPLFGYLDRASGALIGGGGYKGGPSPEGEIEFGYGLAPSFRRLGLATEAATAMIQFAFSHPAVRMVIAHTLPVENASNRLLQRLGFQYGGEVMDPDDGLVWRWELPR